MVELTVGSRFYYKDKLYEVKIQNNPFICTGYVFAYTKKCKKLNAQEQIDMTINMFILKR